MSTHEDRPAESVSSEGARESEWQQIREALRGLRYGTVTIIVQDGVVVQIDRTDKRRLRRPNAAPENSR